MKTDNVNNEAFFMSELLAILDAGSLASFHKREALQQSLCVIFIPTLVPPQEMAINCHGHDGDRSSQQRRAQG